MDVPLGYPRSDWRSCRGTSRQRRWRRLRAAWGASCDRFACESCWTPAMGSPAATGSRLRIAESQPALLPTSSMVARRLFSKFRPPLGETGNDINIDQPVLVEGNPLRWAIVAPPDGFSSLQIGPGVAVQRPRARATRSLVRNRGWVSVQLRCPRCNLQRSEPRLAWAGGRGKRRSASRRSMVGMESHSGFEERSAWLVFSRAVGPGQRTSRLGGPSDPAETQRRDRSRRWRRSPASKL